MPLVLPCRNNSFNEGKVVSGHVIQGFKTMDSGKTVFSLTDGNELFVIHGKRTIGRDVAEAMLSYYDGILGAEKIVFIDGDQVVISHRTTSISEWKRLNYSEVEVQISRMLWCIKRLHDLGYCHLHITPDSFVRVNGKMAVITDLYYSQKYKGKDNTLERKEDYGIYDSPEVFNNSFSTASDYYSLGMVLKEANISLRWSQLADLINGLTDPEPDKRLNYQQAIQVLKKNNREKNTGPRTYIDGKIVGNKAAYSDRQLALYLTENYSYACRYIHKNRPLKGISRSDAASVALLIKSLDPSIPLMWKGKKYPSTKSIAREMDKSFPLKNSEIVEMLKSGILLEYDQISKNRDVLCNTLKLAMENPQEHYWEIARAFGAKYPAISNAAADETYINNYNTDSRLNFKNELVAALDYGNPKIVSEVLQDCSDNESLNKIAQRLHSIPKRGGAKNLWRVNLDAPFGNKISTELPDAGGFAENVDINLLFRPDQSFIVGANEFEQWTQSNIAIRRLKRQRNSRLIRALAWLGLGAGAIVIIISILPYLIAVGLVFLVLMMFLGL